MQDSCKAKLALNRFQCYALSAEERLYVGGTEALPRGRRLELLHVGKMPVKQERERRGQR